MTFDHRLPKLPRFPTLRQGLALIVIPSLALVGIEFYQVARNFPELRRSQELVAHAIEVITTAQALDRAIRDVQRGQRTFLITGDAAYLDSYRRGVQEIPSALSRLKQLTADNPAQQPHWPILEQEIDSKLNDIKRAIEVRQREGFDAARRMVEANAGVPTIDAIAQAIDTAVRTENGLLMNRQALTSEAQRTIAFFSLIGGTLALLIMGVGGVLVWASLRRISESERALSESEGKFRGLLESAPDAMVVANESGLITLVNAQTESMFGYSREELIGKPVEVLIPARLRDRHIHHRSAFLDHPHARPMGKGLELFGRRSDGTEVPIEVGLSPQQTAEGLLVLSTIRDITERKNAEAALMRERKERDKTELILRQAHKMDVLGQLSGGIAHDFNNMLGVIVGILDILQRRIHTEDPKIRDPIQIGMQAAERSAALTHRLLAFSRQQPLEPRAVDVNKLVTGMSGLLDRTLGEDITIETVLAAGLWAIFADINQLENSLLNLAINARDAMPNGGKLTIETANTYLDEAYASTNAGVTTGQYVMLAVTDGGIGMSEETIDRAFDPFFTTKEPGYGTGLGLSQVYGFIKQSGGHVKIYSEVGQGTTVKLYLPRAAGEDIGTREESIVLPVPARQRSETILVVEDNELLLTSVATMLEEQGYRVLTATDATTALQMLDSAPDIRLLFTDIVLPGGSNGRQLADEARRRRPDLLVLFTTGYTRNAIIHQGRLDADVELIVKPFTYAALVAKVQRVLEKGQSTVQPPRTSL